MAQRIVCSSCCLPLPAPSQVGEEDMMCGLWRRRCSKDSTRVALSLLQLGLLERAQALLADLNSAVSAGQIVVGTQSMRGLLCSSKRLRVTGSLGYWHCC
jgi:hypothetical protein